MSDKIFVDAAMPAILKYGDVSIACLTLQEAKIAWARLSEEDKEGAKIKCDGFTYDAEQIEQLHHK
jgi:hypothetical protein